MIREPITGPRAWTRRTIRESDWRIAVPSSCLAEIEQLARVLERDPAPTFLLDPSDYELDACRNLLGEVRRRLDEGPGVAGGGPDPDRGAVRPPADRGRVLAAGGDGRPSRGPDPRWPSPVGSDRHRREEADRGYADFAPMSRSPRTSTTRSIMHRRTM